MKRNTRTGLWALVFSAALAANIAAGFALGPSRPLVGDAYYFLQLAESLRDGAGYVVRDGFWPDTPSMRRMPAWPFVASLALRAVPGANPHTAMRVSAMLLNVLAALAVTALAARIVPRPAPAGAVGLAYALHPTALYDAHAGLSEPLFILLAAAGTAALLGSGRRRAIGALGLGCACLARANFVLWLPLAALSAGVWAFCRRFRPSREQWIQAALAAVLFVLPAGLWMVRNASVSGAFPVLSTLRGQTFYGGNNEVVANQLEHWGYWVFPDSIPGEIPMAQLAAERSELEVDVYYFRRGKTFVRDNARNMPRLWLGKMVRAFVPVPWKPAWPSAAASVYRWGLYLCALAGLCRAGRRLGALYGIALTAMALTALITVLAFWGCARFAFALEPFLLPSAALAFWSRSP